METKAANGTGHRPYWTATVLYWVHALRLGRAEAERRMALLEDITLGWEHRRPWLVEPPVGWDALLRLLFWRGVFYSRRLAVYAAVFAYAADAAEETARREREGRAAWEAQERERAAWRRAGRLFRAWEAEKAGRYRRRRRRKAGQRSSDPYTRALQILGLRGKPSTKEELVRAYWQAIFDAHPDRGGTTEEAQEVNGAKDFIMRHHGWR